ncbi:hypothetical protein ABZP36_025067 [Zizania latifolia]
MTRRHGMHPRKLRANGSVERQTTARKPTSQNPGRKVYTPDVNNKPQAKPNVCFPIISSAGNLFQLHFTEMTITPDKISMNSCIKCVLSDALSKVTFGTATKILQI